MSIHAIDSFLLNPQTCTSFAQILSLTEQAKKVRGVLRNNNLERFCQLLPSAIEKVQQNNPQVNLSAWQKFDRSFSFLVKPFIHNEDLLEKVFKIETLCGRHFTKLDPKLSPIAIINKKGEKTIIPRSSLNSEVFQTMLSCGFAESRAHELDLSLLSLNAFSSIASCLKHKSVNIFPENLEEIFSFAHAHAHVRLFNAGFACLIGELRKPEENKSVDLDKICNDLFILLDFEEESFMHSFAQLNLDQSKKKVQQCPMNPFFEQLFKEDKETQWCFSAFINYLGNIFKSQPAKAKALYTFAAMHGDNYGQYNLGNCYAKGLGCPKDVTKAREWITKAAERDCKNAQYDLAEGSRYGNEVFPMNRQAALLWYKKAAENNYAPAQVELGLIFEYANLVASVDFEQVVFWYEKAALQGFPAGQYRLACHYESGSGIEKNMTKAMKWYEKAASAGIVPAQLRVGEFYEKSSDAAEQKKAVEWYEKAAKKGNSQACIKLKDLYTQGTIVPQDLVKAKKYAERAAALLISSIPWLSYSWEHNPLSNTYR